MNYVTTNELTTSLQVTSQRVAAIAKQLLIDKDETSIRGRNRCFTPQAVKKILSHRGVDYSVKSITAFCNNKGGVGKTSLAVNTSLRLSHLGFKVLLLDADPQGNATSYILNDYNYSKVLHDVVSKNCELEETIIRVDDYLDILPSNLANSRLDMQISTLQINQRTFFKKMLSNLDYNYIIWDLSPSISTTNFLALLSCTHINIVTTLTDFSIQGLEMTNDVINKAKENFNDYNPKVQAIINMYDSRMKSSLEHLPSIKEIGINIFDNVIRVDNTMNKAQTYKQELLAGSNAHKDICALVDKMIGIQKNEKDEENVH